MYLVLTAMCAGPCRTLRNMPVFYTPRFSYDGSETPVTTTRTPLRPTRAVRCTGQDGYTGGCTGWVIRVGIPGTQPRCSREVTRQRSGPRKPHGGWSGWSGTGRTGFGGGTAPGYHPAGPVGAGPPAPPCTQDPQNAASGPNKARIDLIS